jgi:hypothetical protein
LPSREKVEHADDFVGGIALGVFNGATSTDILDFHIRVLDTGGGVSPIPLGRR